MLATVGEVKGQRVALLKNAVVTDVETNASGADKQELYKPVPLCLDDDEIGVFDAGFKIVAATEADLEWWGLRLALNGTFGKTPGEIPERPSAKGRTPTQYTVAMGAFRRPGGRNLHPHK